jgi:teichuronic acid biosynthesis glycosyltransferase TuaH
LKLYEYLAAGLPVVSADVPAARRFQDLVAIAVGRTAWETAISAELGSASSEAASRRREAVRDHTWDARVETLSGYLAEALGVV